MVQKTIVLKGVLPMEKRFVVDIKDANRERRNRSFANASDCHGARLKQEKFCSSCNVKVEGTPSRKLVKIGKEEYLIDADVLEKALEQLEQMEDVTIHSVLEHEPTGASEYYDALAYVLPVEKKQKEYAELVELMKGKVAVGTGVFRSNEFQVLLTVGEDGVVRIRKLVEQSQRYGLDVAGVREKLAGVQVNEEYVGLMRRALEKSEKQDVDLSVFKDSRSQIEEQIIEDVVLHGKMPELKSVQLVSESEQDEMRKLKEFLG